MAKCKRMNACELDFMAIDSYNNDLLSIIFLLFISDTVFILAFVSSDIKICCPNTMLVDKNKKQKKYFNRGAKQKYVKIFNTAQRSQKPLMTTGIPFVNPYSILTIMAGLSIFFTTTFVMQNATSLSQIRFEFTLPRVDFENPGRSLAEQVRKISIPTIQLPNRPASPSVQTPKKQIEIPRIQLPRLDIGGKITAFFDMIGNGFANLLRFLNPIPVIKTVFTTIASFISNIARAIGSFFVSFIMAIGDIMRAILGGIGDFFRAIWMGLMRLLSPLDPRPAVGAVNAYFKSVFAPVATTTKESSVVVGLFGGSLKQTFSDIGKGFSTLGSVFKYLRS